MEYRASDTGSEVPRHTEVSVVGQKDFMFGVTGVGLMVLVAIAFALFS
jgi:hypothetical protein